MSLRKRDTTRDVVPLREAAKAWFAVSLQTFGGPAGQIAVMHRELVEERRWIGEERFLHALSYCTLIPGPEAQQLATYLGWLLNGGVGGLIAGSLFVLPGYLAIMALSLIYAGFGDTTAVAAVFAGVAPAVLAIVAQAVWRVGGRALKNRFLVGVAVAAFAALFVFAVPFPFVIAAAGLTGFVGGRIAPALFSGGAHGRAKDAAVPPLIADDALHGAGPSWGRAFRIGAVGIVLWALPVVVLGIVFGGRSIFVREGTFFTGTALVTFGGAYAVLSYVAQRAVTSYHWLLPGEMVKGLAMAETTPGPLIQVVQFVAFLGAYRSPGTLNPWVAAIIGATLVTWVTYVPCFLFIFLGAPHIEQLGEQPRLSAALTAITAAVVGVILNLGVKFTTHALWPEPAHAFDAFVAVVAVTAFIAMQRFKLGLIPAIAACAALGLLWHGLGSLDL